MVPWFHGSTLFLGRWNHGTMEPRFQATHFGFHGSMVPPKFLGWNHGTLEPRFQATQKRFHGSKVPGWNHGTLEPKCVICLLDTRTIVYIFCFVYHKKSLILCLQFFIPHLQACLWMQLIKETRLGVDKVKPKGWLKYSL